MRTKDEILDHTIKPGPGSQKWDTTASTHERLTIEVLIDIRDQLTELNQTIDSKIFLLGREG